jgi:hypothetical protein
MAGEMGRSTSVLCEKAKTLGLTDSQGARVRSAQAARVKCAGIPKWVDRPHPRGFAGGSHSAATREGLRVKSAAYRASLTSDQAGEIAGKAMRTRVANGHSAPKVQRGTWKAGWREIGGCKKYYRSRWEANYARYLQWLCNRGDLLDWKHEPETFWFEGIKRGVRSYLPDFRVWENDGTSKLHEVKGWMDDRSRTTLKRMAKYHPAETIVLIKEKDYRAIERTVGALIEGWE